MNPHRLDLGRVGLILRSDPNGEPESDPSALSNVEQRLSLWSGTIASSFGYAGEAVVVTTAVDPDSATVAYRIASSLLASGHLGVELAFPYASDGFMKTADWESNDRHTTVIVAYREGGARIERTLDATTYAVELAWSAGAQQGTAEADHRFQVTSASGLPGPRGHIHSRDTVLRRRRPSTRSLRLPQGGGSRSGRVGRPSILRDRLIHERGELERRIVLSQYVTAVNCAGSMPPQETGLVANSWHGKSHLEMHWWHAAHFATWGRPELLAKSTDWYRSILPSARGTAQHQGSDGARWPPDQVGPDGRENPE